MLEAFSEIRDEVRSLIYKHKDYEKAIVLGKKYIQMIRNMETTEDKSGDLVVGFYCLGLASKKDNKFEIALKYALNALKYTKPFQYDYNHIMTKWLIAEIKFELGDNEYAIKTYRDCQVMFEKLDQMRYSACMRFNIYKIQMNEEEMLSLTKEYQNFIINENKPNYTYLDEAQKDSLLQDMYLELADIYIIKDRRYEAFNLMKNVKNKELRNKIYDKLVAEKIS